MLITESIFEIRDLPFINDVKARGGKIFSVGGAIRDAFLNKQSKDLDILITNIPVDDLMEILHKYGKVDLVGMSFGIIKFKPTGETEDIDIAIPRTERKMGDGHKGFAVHADPFLPIEKDLERRDFTINAIAKDLDGNIIDPFHGLEDIKNKVIRVVNPVAFSDDPLRMLRAVQFASRFKFTIEPETMALIKRNAPQIRSITGERVLIELEKITSKGDPTLGAQLLHETGLFENIFGTDFSFDIKNFNNVRTLGEFIFMLLRGTNLNAVQVFKTTLKGDIDTAKEIQALEVMSAVASISVPGDKRLQAFQAINISGKVLDSQIFPMNRTTISEMKSGKFPRNFKELAVNGNDLMGAGYKGVEVGEMLKWILKEIMFETIQNDHKTIMNWVVSNKMRKLA